MNVVFEVNTRGLKKSQANKVAGNAPVIDAQVVGDVEDLVDTPNTNVETDAEKKARLQGVLTDAGITFKAQHGINKLQELVDSIQPE